jgi:hypothetical protein
MSGHSAQQIAGAVSALKLARMLASEELDQISRPAAAVA